MRSSVDIGREDAGEGWEERQKARTEVSRVISTKRAPLTPETLSTRNTFWMTADEEEEKKDKEVGSRIGRLRERVTWFWTVERRQW